MKYYEVKFTLSPYSTDACDVLLAMAGEAGFESFEETSDGLLGYVQQSLFSEDTLKEVIADFPFERVTITYDLCETEDRDWNEQWESEGFEPIVIMSKENSSFGIVIHDGRHLPTDVISSHFSLSNVPSVANSPRPGVSFLQIEIDAHQAFGTGTHETTRMICAEVIQYAHNARVLDCGNGTGILSICALKLGAKEAVGYDIDEWSVDNARHNAVINHVDDRFTSLLGDANILNNVEGTFDLVLANINRNILLNDLPAFRKKMSPGARLILSGFYTTDSPLLIEKAASLGLTIEQQKEDHNWACLVFSLFNIH